MSIRRGARALLVVGVAATVSLSAGAAASTANGPLNVVRRYLAALAEHDARGVCATFSPQLRRFDLTWEPQGKTCVRSVAASHFSSYSPGYNVRRIRIVRVTGIDVDRYGTVGVHLVLFFRFPCIDEVSAIPGCRPHFEDRRDVIYLRSERGRWLVVKPGEIYADTSEDGAPWFDALWPPAVPWGVDRRARIGPPAVTCPAGGAAASAHGRAPRWARRAPWLLVDRVRLVWLGRRQLCATLTLGAPPRADSSYIFGLEQPGGAGVTGADFYAVDIDGVGTLVPRLRDGRSEYGSRKPPCPTEFGLVGDRLTMIFSPGGRVFDYAKPISVEATTLSLQPGEPLLAHPLNAEDDVPDSGINLRPPQRPLPRCVSI